MPVDIGQLSEGWLELESDPGLFTLLLEDFGVKGVQVEEIYDLLKPIESNPVYGFIFLFRWTEERRSRRKFLDSKNIFVKDEEVVNSLFFAQQMVPNSCATHALLSVLLNCPKIQLGDTLDRLKTHTCGMGPENKGWAIGNTPELAKAHNSHATPQARHRMDKGSGISTGRFIGEAFHFVSYVPINGRLYELDGLKPYPIDHGPWNESEDWTDKFQHVMKERLGMATVNEANGDIHYNLMAVVPDKRLAITHKLNMLKTNRQIVLDALQQLVHLNSATLSPGTTTTAAPPDETRSSSFSPNMKRSWCLPNKSEPTAAAAAAPSELCTTKLLKTSTKCADNKTLRAADCPVPAAVAAAAPLISAENFDRKSIVVGDKYELLVEKKADYTAPLTIQTSPVPSTSSTDTSSEIGSAFNSPGLNSPHTKDFSKFVVIRVAMGDASDNAIHNKDSVRKVCLEAGALPFGWERPPCRAGTGSVTTNCQSVLDKKDNNNWQVAGESRKDHHVHQTFAPKDLHALVKNLEAEINTCEGLLREENEKRKQYKVDDCRRSHNYDQFICTFLSMLAQQGKLADLVQQHLLVQRKLPTQINNNLTPVVRTANSSKRQHITLNTKKKKGRAKSHSRK